MPSSSAQLMSTVARAVATLDDGRAEPHDLCLAYAAVARLHLRQYGVPMAEIDHVAWLEQLRPGCVHVCPRRGWDALNAPESPDPSSFDPERHVALLTSASFIDRALPDAFGAHARRRVIGDSFTLLWWDYA